MHVYILAVHFFRQERQIREKVGSVLQNWTAATVNKVYVARGEQSIIGHHSNSECCWSLGEEEASLSSHRHTHLHSELRFQFSSRVLHQDFLPEQRKASLSTIRQCFFLCSCCCSNLWCKRMGKNSRKWVSWGITFGCWPGEYKTKRPWFKWA